MLKILVARFEFIVFAFRIVNGVLTVNSSFENCVYLFD
jgi:hypothetical protein